MKSKNNGCGTAPGNLVKVLIIHIDWSSQHWAYETNPLEGDFTCIFILVYFSDMNI